MQISTPVYKFLLFVYSKVYRTGLLKNEWIKNKCFIPLYFLYKRYLEDPFSALIAIYPELFQGGSILDIGANIGYTSILFSKIVTHGFKVYAFEPDVDSFSLLTQVINHYNLKDKVVLYKEAVGADAGIVEFWHSTTHPADSKIFNTKLKKAIIDTANIFSTSMTSIDLAVEGGAIQLPIKFIKIDVQGYELPVCIGMQKTLTKNPDAIVAVEYSPNDMLSMGFSPDALWDFFRNNKYFVYILHNNGKLILASSENLKKALKKKAYIDLLCSLNSIKLKS